MDARTRIVRFLQIENIDYPSIVFVRRRADAEAVAEALQGASGLRVAWVHGALTKAARTTALAAMRDGSLDLVVATDCWATGVDVPGLRTVIMAGGGRAPILLKQRAGRGSRIDEGRKPWFKVIDIAGPDEREQANQRFRAQHYVDAGYELVSGDVELPTVPPETGELEPSVMLKTLLKAHEHTLPGDERVAVEPIDFKRSGLRFVVWTFILGVVFWLLELCGK